jgi:hypothetical protein
VNVQVVKLLWIAGLLAACGRPAPVVVAVEEPGPAAAPAPAVPAPAPAAPGRPWIDVAGMSIVGVGVLRLVPPPGRPATFRIRYHEFPDGYAAAANLQLFVLPGDAFAASDRAYAGDFLAFTRTPDEAATAADGALRLETAVTAAEERTVLVAYGPWTAPDAGRPAGDRPTFGLEVASDDGAHEWIESEAGELITTNWTLRDEVTRGRPVRDPVAGGDLYIEVRPMILYDARLVRARGESAAACEGPSCAELRAEADRLDAEGKPALACDRRERADDLDAARRRRDRTIEMTPELAEKFRRVPIRWR